MDYKAMTDLLEHNLEEARIKILPSLSISSKKYGKIMDNMLKTVHVLQSLPKPNKEDNRQQRMNHYNTLFGGKRINDLPLGVMVDESKDIYGVMTSPGCGRCEELKKHLLPKLDGKIDYFEIPFEAHREYFQENRVGDSPMGFLISKGIIKKIMVGFDVNHVESYIREMNQFLSFKE